ncbi:MULTISPECIES: serine hydrolase domain-containing protein [Serratia]|uniref:Esterase estB n=1 Tax=Serratia quinivorans TaxID=137545 RepID=A0A380B362_9GAMM|nr:MULTISPECIES: serine hydrolase domain-containing protein [Serratia]QBX65541.1 class A beta-lactamase-related serine hydrolase [Serratia quinivorans]RYM57257.1 serine hydrolase [Serratia proteamaculans]CAI1659030.1 Esterase estB [Serratia quinivorans]SUI92312.1 Esterase estB [Serratia quinivorans]
MSELNQSLIKRVQAVSQKAIAEQRIVGSVVLVAQHGKVIYAEASGYADREQQKLMRRETQFRLSSVSKPYITLAAMRMVEQHKLGLDDAVSRWLPWFTPSLADGRQPEIKIRHLLSHSAGLGYRFNQPVDGPYQRLGIQDGLALSSLTLEQNLRLLAQADLLAEPGSEFHYSLAIDVLGAVLEQVAGKPLPQVFEHWVAQPLGLGNTGFYTSDADNLATAYHDTATRPEPLLDGMLLTLPEEFGFDIEMSPSRALDPSAFASGGAGMVGDADDVLRMVETLRSGGEGILQPASVELMRQPHVGAEAEVQGPGWGFGFGGAVLVDAQLAATPQHNGTLQWSGVYGHSWFYDPQAALSVVALTNTAFEGMSGMYPQQIRDAVYGD